MGDHDKEDGDGDVDDDDDDDEYNSVDDELRMRSQCVDTME